MSAFLNDLIINAISFSVNSTVIILFQSFLVLSERKAFAKEMAFREERFTAEVGYLKGLMGEILDRLPTVTVDRQISEKTTTTK